MDVHRKEIEEHENQEPVKLIREILQTSLSQGPPECLDALIRKGEIATQLLSTIPVARSAALETIASCYLAAMRDKSKETEGLKRFLGTTSEVIQSLLEHNQSAWAPVILNWGLGLLVKLCNQHKRRISTQEQIKYWVSNSVARPVLNITFHCLDHSYREDAEKCIRLILEQTKDSNKNCNWLCCHLSMSYIDTSIPLIFRLIKNNKNSEYLTPLIHTLEYLSSQDPPTVRNTILDSFRSVLDKKGEEQRDSILFYLELASQSTVLLNLCAIDVIPLLTAGKLRVLLNHERSITQGSVSLVDDTDHLNRFLHDVVLYLRGASVYAFIEFLLMLSYPERSEGGKESQETGEDGMEEGEVREDSSEVGRVTERLLEYLLIGMENSAWKHVLSREKLSRVQPSEKNNTYLFIFDLTTHTDALLTRFCRQRNEPKLLKALSRLLIVIGVFGSDSNAINILVHCILHGSCDSVLMQIPHLQEKLSLMHPLVMVESVKRCLVKIREMSDAERENTQFYKNTGILLKMEAGVVWRSVTGQIMDELRASILSICDQLNVSTYTDAHAILDFIDIFKLLPPFKARLVTKVNICMKVITLFFRLLEKSVLACYEGELDVHCEMCLVRVRMLLGNYCSSDRQALVFSLRKIVYMCAVEDAPYYHVITGNLRLGNEDENEREDTRLLERMMEEFSVQNAQNYKVNSRVEGKEFAHKPKTLFNPSKTNYKLQRAVNHAVEHVIMLLSQCCLVEMHSQHSIMSYEPLSMQQLAQVILDVIAPSEVPGSREWCDEEALKFSVERHLKIRASVDATPLNLELLLLLANDGVALITCYPIVRAIIYVLANFWSVCKAEKGSECPSELNLSIYTVRILCRAQWLTQQVLCLMEMFEVLPAYEIRQLIEEIQDFLRKNQPDRDEFKVCDTGNNREFPSGCMQTFYDLVNVLLIRNVESIGHLVGTLGMSTLGKEL